MALFAIDRLIFSAIYLNDFAESVLCLYHGLSMDASVAAYLTVIPFLILICSIWGEKKWIKTGLLVYSGLISILLSAIFVCDTVLYGFWGFRLDTTPLFYFSTSPSAAFASASWPLIALGSITFLITAVIIGAILFFITTKFNYSVKNKPKECLSMALVLILLFITIRGGITVSTMNLSRAYFSSDYRLNHTALNPAFNLLYSATHQTDFSKSYRFFSKEDADRLYQDLNKPLSRNDSIDKPYLDKRPDIFIIIMESFSTHLIPSLGGENVALGLDSLAREGLSMQKFYANSFRTDRAIPAILAGIPGQPSTSIMKFVDKIEHLPTLPNKLIDNGYKASYFYGGDANFTNMQAFLVHCGFSKIISDKDFSVTEKMSKWGAPDHLVFKKALEDIKNDKSEKPKLRVIQTSSSHEPFDVPYHNPRFSSNDKLNAFAYADSCLFDFVDSIRTSPGLDNSLIVIVPDHQGVYPENLPLTDIKHHIPCVMLGCGIENLRNFENTPASQIDLSATILGLLGLDNIDFKYSKNIFDISTPHYGVFGGTTYMGLVFQDKTTLINTDKPEENTDSIYLRTQAYLQNLYDYIDQL